MACRHGINEKVNTVCKNSKKSPPETIIMRYFLEEIFIYNSRCWISWSKSCNKLM